MKFSPPLTRGTLLRRYKRFLADVVLDDGTALTAHCPNTGSMLGCADPGSEVWLSRSDSPTRKYPYTLEMVRDAGDTLVGVHTGRSNALVREGIENGLISDLSGYASLAPEVTIVTGSRIDFVLDHPQRRRCIVEVKNVSAAVAGGTAVFPDAVSVRAVRHLELLASCVRRGERAVLVYCVQRADVVAVAPAANIDPEYAATLARVRAAGVEVLAFGAQLDPAGIELRRALAVTGKRGTNGT